MRYRKRDWQARLVDDNMGKRVFENFLFLDKIQTKKVINIEIGCGKGDFLLGQAKKNNDQMYIGIERVKSVLAMSLKKIINNDQNNIFLIRKDAKEILDEKNLENNVDNIYLNFSDPWPKKRHAKRRLTSPLFLEGYKKILKKSGTIFLKTDNLDLFEYSVETLKKNGFKVISKNYDYDGEKNENDSISEYERKFREKNIKIKRLVARLNK